MMNGLVKVESDCGFGVESEGAAAELLVSLLFFLFIYLFYFNYFICFMKKKK
jgi:hypothetical protein